MTCAAILVSVLRRQWCFDQIELRAPSRPSAVVNHLQGKGLVEWDAPVTAKGLGQLFVHALWPLSNLLTRPCLLF